jgi:hypothetical protein
MNRIGTSARKPRNHSPAIGLAVIAGLATWPGYSTQTGERKVRPRVGGLGGRRRPNAVI